MFPIIEATTPTTSTSLFLDLIRWWRAARSEWPRDVRNRPTRRRSDPSACMLNNASQPELHVKLLRPEAALPSYQSALAAGMDLVACLPDGSVVLNPVHRGGKILKIPTGLAIAISPGFEAQVRPRSGLAANHGVTLPNAPGTVDADYRGEVLVPLINLGPEPYTITHGMRIAQMVIAPVARAVISQVSDLSETARSTGGFGSTGTH